MSLNWSIEKVRNFEELKVWGKLNGMGDVVPEADQEAAKARPNAHWRLEHCTQAMVYAMMGIGMGSITKANWKEVYTRLSLWEKVFGPLRWKRTEDEEHVSVYFTAADVERRVGLITNVSNETSAAFLKRVYGHFSRERHLEAEDSPGESTTELLPQPEQEPEAACTNVSGHCSHYKQGEHCCGCGKKGPQQERSA